MWSLNKKKKSLTEVFCRYLSKHFYTYLTYLFYNGNKRILLPVIKSGTFEALMLLTNSKERIFQRPLEKESHVARCNHNDQKRPKINSEYNERQMLVY